MSFLYPRLIQITRPNTDAAVGTQPYGGVTEANETTIAAGIPAHIESDRQGTAPAARLPGDAAGQSIWRVSFRGALGLTQDRDVVTDDLGVRYQIISAEWQPLGYDCRCQILET